MDKVLELLIANLDNIVLAVLAILGTFVFKNNTDVKDAVASIRTASQKAMRENPRFKEIIADGKISADEWKELFGMVGPEAIAVATKGGAKVLNRWLDKESVAHKYIELICKEIATEFGSSKTV